MSTTPPNTTNNTRINRSRVTSLGTQNHAPMSNSQRASQRRSFIRPTMRPSKRDLLNRAKITICNSSRSIVVSSSFNQRVRRSWCTRRRKGIGQLSTRLVITILMRSTFQVIDNSMFQPTCSIQMTDLKPLRNPVKLAKRLPKRRSPRKKNWRSSWIFRCSRLRCWWTFNNSWWYPNLVIFILIYNQKPNSSQTTTTSRKSQWWQSPH